VVDEAKARGQAGVVEGANEVVASFLTFSLERYRLGRSVVNCQFVGCGRRSTLAWRATTPNWRRSRPARQRLCRI